MILFCDGRDPRVYHTFYFINWAYKVRICWQSNQLMNSCDPYQLSTLSYDVYDAPKKSSRLQVSQFVRPFCNNYFFSLRKTKFFFLNFHLALLWSQITPNGNIRILSFFVVFALSEADRHNNNSFFLSVSVSVRHLNNGLKYSRSQGKYLNAWFCQVLTFEKKVRKFSF